MIKIFFILFFPLLLLSNPLLNQAEKDYIKNKKVIYVSNELDYEPYDYNINGKPVGYSIDLLRLISRDLGLEIKYVSKPWNELLDDLNTKKIDLIHTIYKTPEREKLYTYSVGYSKVVHSYVIRKDVADVKSIEDLYGKKIGIIKGWSEESFFNKFPQITKVHYDTLQDKLADLSIGKIDFIVSSRNVAHYNIKKHGYTNLKISTPVDSSFVEKLDDHHFAALKENTLLIDIINKAYINIPISDIERLNKKWFGNVNETNISFTPEESMYLDNKDSITMCADPDWLPFERINRNGDYEGIGADFYKLFKEKLNIDFKLIKTENWTQTLDFAKSRKCDIISMAMRTPNRESDFKFTSPYIESPIVAVTNLNFPFIENLADLNYKRIGIIKDYAIIELIKNRFPSIEIVEVKNMEEGLSLVSNQKIFAFVDTLPALTYNYQNLQDYNLKVAGKLGINWELSMAVRNDDEKLYSILEKTVKSISYIEKKEIMDRWINTRDNDKGLDYSLLIKVAAIFLIIVLFFMYKNRLMKKSIEDFSNLIDSTLEAIIIFENGKCTNVNKSAIEIFNYKSKKDFMSKTIVDFISDESKDIVAEYFKYPNNLPFEILVKKSSGENFPALVNFSKMKYKNSVLFSVIDITPIKQLESQSKQAQMGEMIENIAHQWRQPLSSISSIASAINLALLVGIQETKESLISDMDKIVKTTKHLSETIDIFRNFLKEKKVLKEFILQDKVNIALEIVSGSLKNHHIEVVNRIKEEPIKITSISGELEQVLINIINNAKDVLIERDILNPWIELDLIVDDNSVILTVEDNGRGIDKEILNKIFNPYFTTKHSSQGTGLGLFMSYKIITESLKGKLLVNNTEYGAKFYIEIPMKIEKTTLEE